MFSSRLSLSALTSVAILLASCQAKPVQTSHKKAPWSAPDFGQIHVMKDGEVAGCLDGVGYWYKDLEHCPFLIEIQPFKDSFYISGTVQSGTLYGDIGADGNLEFTGDWAPDATVFYSQGPYLLNSNEKGNGTTWYAAADADGSKKSSLYQLPEQTGSGENAQEYKLTWVSD